MKYYCNIFSVLKVGLVRVYLVRFYIALHFFGCFPTYIHCTLPVTVLTLWVAPSKMFCTFRYFDQQQFAVCSL